MFDKHWSARSLPFVLSESSIRNFWALKLLSKSLERDVLVKKSARELALLACKPFSEQTKRVMNSRKRGVIMLIKRLQYFRRLLVFANLSLSLSYRLLIMSNACKCVSHCVNVPNLIWPSIQSDRLILKSLQIDSVLKIFRHVFYNSFR